MKSIKQPLGALEISIWSISLVVAIFGVFWLPWSCGLTAPVSGESYVLGFNNQVAILALGLSILLAIVARLLARRTQSALAWIVTMPRLIPSWQEAKLEYAILAIWGVIWSTVIFSWGNFLVDPAWSEARGFFFGIDMLALGRVPYRDFEFIYGPATLYLPFWLSKLTGGLMSFEQSYLTVLIIFTNTGFAAIFLLLRSLEIPTSLRPAILLLCLLPWAQLTMGLTQCAPLRFFIIPAGLILLSYVVRGKKFGPIKRMFHVMFSSFFVSAAFLSISPEVGIAGSVALIAYGVALFLVGSRKEAIACFIGCILVSSVTLLTFPYYLLSVFAFASGGNNFPVYPNFHNIALVAIALFTLPAMITASIKGWKDPRSPLILGLAVGGGMLLPAALGRCDPGHVFCNGAILSIMMFPAVVGLRKRWFYCWLSTYTILYIFMLQYSYWGHYYNTFIGAIQMRRFYDQNPEIVSSWHDEWNHLRLSSKNGKGFHWSCVLPFPKDLQQFTERGIMLQTSGDAGTLWLARYLMLQKNYPKDYFHAYSNGAETHSQIEQKVRDSSAARFLIMPEDSFAPLTGPIDLIAYQNAANTFLSKLLLFPTHTLVKNAPYFHDAEFAKLIFNSYYPIARYQNLIILEKKTTDHAQ